MTTEQYSIGYEAGYQDGFDAALSEPVKQEPVEYHVENVYERGDKYFAWIGDGYVQIYTAPVSAEAAVLAEREACAKVCEEEHDNSKFGCNGMHCAAAIRARGEK